MRKQYYLHFTDLAGIEGIKQSGVIWKSSYGPINSVFATVVGGAWVPGVQMSSMGRAKIRSQIILFESNLLPDVAYPEEVMWHMSELPVKVKNIVSPSKAKKILTDSISFDEETGMLKIDLHPCFNDFYTGEWTRMPEDFESWLPGKDNKKYLTARKIWLETKDIEKVRLFWEQKL
jgi:hypothetical protein